MTENVNTPANEVNGVGVEARERAKMKDLRVGHEGNFMVLDTVDECLLTDGTVIFQCVHPNRGGCVYTNADPRSVVSHQRAHGPKTTANRLKRELVIAEANEAKAKLELAERRKRRSDGSRRGAETRKQRQITASQPAEDDPRVLLANEIQFGIKKIRGQVGAIQHALEYIVEDLDNLAAIAKLVPNLPGADATTLEKARRYDILTTPLTNPIK